MHDLYNLFILGGVFVSESREQVAAELEDVFSQVVHVCRMERDDCRYCYAVKRAKEIMARALAACALSEHDFHCVPCANAVRAKCLNQRCGRGALLERAAEEKS